MFNHNVSTSFDLSLYELVLWQWGLSAYGCTKAQAHWRRQRGC